MARGIIFSKSRLRARSACKDRRNDFDGAELALAEAKRHGANINAIDAHVADLKTRRRRA